MKKFFKNDIYLLISLLFLVLLFRYNSLFKTCIIEGCTIFFKQVFPTLFPMFIINDLFIDYQLITYLNRYLKPLFYRLFHFSNAATYIFITSLFSGTPTNGYITNKLVTENNLNKEDASIILSYSFFLNPLFLYNMLMAIFNNTQTVVKLIVICYAVNLIFAFYHRHYHYQDICLTNTQNNNSFAKNLSNSISKSFTTLIQILGTMIFYFILCEGIQILFKNQFLNCLFNGLLEVTGGLSKLPALNISYFLKEILAILFMSFGGFSIHSQIKSIIAESNISFKPFFKTRIIHFIISALILIAIS